MAEAAAGTPAFITATLDDLKKLVDAPPDFEENRLLIEEHDHWQRKTGWIGNRPDENDPLANDHWERIQAQFMVRDATSEIVERPVDALLKREPHVSWALRRTATEAAPETPEETARIAEIDAFTTAWWDAQRFQEVVKAAARGARWGGRGREGLAFLRAWLPASFRDADGKVSAEDVGAGMLMIHLAAPLLNTATRVRDKETQREAFVILEGTGEDQSAQVYYLDPETDETVIRYVGKDVDTEVRLELGGRMLMAEVRARKLITHVVRLQQRRLNFGETMLVRLMEQAGTPDRYVIDAKPSGYWKRVPPGVAPDPGATTRTNEDGTTDVLVPRPRMIGGPTTTELHSTTVATKDGDGEQPLRATVEVKEPTNPEGVLAAIEHAYTTMLEEARQAHVLTSTDARPSGRSRQEARADFESDIQSARSSVESAAREIIEAVVSLAEVFAGSPGRYTEDLRCIVDLHVDTGPVSPEEMEQDRKAVSSGLLSKETAMSRAGVEDIMGEIGRIREEPEAQLEMRAKLAETLSNLVASGGPDADVVLLAVAAGYDEADAKKWFGHITTERRRRSAEDGEINDARERRDDDVPVAA